jgi:hypothetical protein
MAPARQRIKRETLRLDHRGPLPTLATPHRSPLLCAIHPNAAERSTRTESLRAMHSRPIFNPAHKTFLAPMRQEVLEPPNLSRFLVAHNDRLVAAPPHPLSPARPPSDFSGDVRADIAHEVGEAFHAFDEQQHVAVIRKEYDSANFERIAALGPRKDADENFVQVGPRGKQKAPLKGSIGDLDEGTTWRNESEISSHGSQETQKDPSNLDTI